MTFASQNHHIIAEIGSVHDGSLGNAGKLIELAASCGATAVKFQTHIAEAETLANAPAPSYFKAEPRMEYFRRTGFDRAGWQQLKDIADAAGIAFLSSPFSIEAVHLLEEIGMEAYKIPSGEVTNIPMLEEIAALGKPVLLSSGMSNWAELDAAVAVFDGKCPFVVMQCSSAYPCPPEQVGLNVLAEMKQRYGTAIGFSDHTLGVAASMAAASLGAVVIEKHFTFSKHMYGSDAKHSMEPTEFSQFADGLNAIWAMLSNPVDKDDISPYGDMKDIFQKSIVAAADLTAGTRLEAAHLAFKKPGTGIPASRYGEILGRILNRDCNADEMIKEEWLS